MEIAQVDPRSAAVVLRERGLRAPLSCDTPEDIAAHAQCFAARDAEDAFVFALRRQGDVLWIDGAASVRGRAAAVKGFPLAQQIARELGCRTVAFETARPALVRVAERQGFETVGYVLKKDIL